MIEIIISIAVIQSKSDSDDDFDDGAKYLSATPKKIVEQMGETVTLLPFTNCRIL